MKCKKIVAVTVALASIMAFATSGFAATVNTTTTYNQYTDKVTVDVDVTEVTNATEVTYLVKGASDKIVYIDQQTVNAGAVGFAYKFNKADLDNLTAAVQFGSNGTDEITDSNIAFSKVTVNKGNAAVTFYSDENCEKEITDAELVVGKEETVYAKVVANDGYTVKTVKNGENVVDAVNNVYAITNPATITVETEANAVTPTVEIANDLTYDITKQGEKTFSTVRVIRITAGTPSEVGINYDGQECKAMATVDTAFTGNVNDLCAVEIIDVIGNLSKADAITAYCK